MSFSISPKAAALALLVFAIAAACSNSREGERCDKKNDTAAGNEDCQDGLECKAILFGTATTARCCPKNNAPSTDPACTSSQSTVIGDSSTSTPFDSGAGETSVPADAAGQ